MGCLRTAEESRVVVKSDAAKRGVNCVLYTVHWLHFAQGLVHHGCPGKGFIRLQMTLATDRYFFPVKEYCVIQFFLMSKIDLFPFILSYQ